MSFAGNDAAGLFGGPAARDGDGAEGTNKKRVTLKDSESVAAVMFKAWEASTLEIHQPKELWKYIAQGNKYIEYHSELAATAEAGGDYRVGVGLSRHAGLLVNAIERLKEDQSLKRLIVKGAYDKAMGEANHLLPHLKKLNFGKGSLTKDEGNESLKNLKNKRARTEEAVILASEEDIEIAVKVLLEWLGMEKSALRGLLVVLSAGGLPYAAMAGERTLRAWTEAGGATAESATRAAKAVRMARMGSVEPGSASTAASTKNDIDALFTGK